MKNRTNYGKIIAITLSVVTSACAIAFVIYRLFRNLIEFCNTYQIPEEDVLDELEFCDEEEECDEGENEETPETAEESAEADA